MKRVLRRCRRTIAVWLTTILALSSLDVAPHLFVHASEPAWDEGIVSASDETEKPEDGVIVSGEYKENGSNVTWAINADGKLTVEGTGEFAGAFVGAPSADVNIKRAPWYEDREAIKSAEIKVSGMTNAAYMFRDCNNLVSVNLENFNTSQVVHMNGMFSGCSSLESLNVSEFDTENAMYMSEMFMGCAKLKTLDVSKFNTGNVIWMNRMFADCGSLESIDVSRFITGKVENFKEMFKGCSSLTSLNVSSFDTGVATNISNMFEGCSSLTSLNLSSFDTKAATNMSRMFIGCSSLENLDLGNFETANVTLMQHMFNGCSSLKSLTLGSKFDTGQVTNMLSMFRDCSSLTGLDVSGFNTENVTDMGHMFNGCSSLTSLNLSGFTTGNATNMSGMFGGCSALTSLDLSSFDVGKLEREEYVVFAGCTSLTTIRTPYNLNCKIPLNLNPDSETEATDKWYDEAGNKYTELPQNLDHSILIRKNEKPVTIIASGEYKENGSDVTWVITADGKLTVEGTGEFAGEFVGAPSADVNIKRAPWYDHREDIVSAEINVTGMTNAAFMLRDCSNLVSVDLENFDTSQVFNMQGMFYNCSSLESLNVSKFDTRNVTSMAEMFQGCVKLKTLDVSSFNTGNVTWTARMFAGCSSLESLDLSRFNTGKVDNFKEMFSGCSNLPGLNISHFDTSAATNISNMFEGCSSLKNLDLSGFNTANVTNMSRMFYGCSGIESLDLSSFDTGNVELMQHMFRECTGLKSVKFGSRFDTGRVTNMLAMFRDCSSLEDLDVSGFNVENVTDIRYVFSGCSSLTTIHTPYNLKSQIPLPKAEETDIWYDEAGNKYAELPQNLDHSILIRKNEKPVAIVASGEYKEDGSNVTWVLDADGKLTVEGTGEFARKVEGKPSDTVNTTRAPWYDHREDIVSAEIKVSGMTDAAFMFRDCSNLVSVDLENFDTSQVFNMQGMFYNCSSLESLDVSGFNTENVTAMSDLFFGCAKLTSLDVSKFNTGNVTRMAGMFDGCSSLSGLNVSSFNTSAATDMSRMFNGCSSLKSLDLKNFDTSNVTNMARMFLDCHGLESLDLSRFDTHKAEQMQHMFGECENLKSLTLSSKFDTAQVTNMLAMFRNCSSLESIDLSSFNTGNVTDIRHMFNGCSSLTSLDVSGFKTGSATDLSSMFDYCSALTSLDLSSFDAGKLEREEFGMFRGCTSLTTIHTPYHLSRKVLLTDPESTDIWYDEAGNKYTELPQNLDHSILIRKNKKPVAIIASGEYKEDGSDVTWVIDADGKLTVEGTGEFAVSFGGKPSDPANTTRAPWYENREAIVSAEINVSGMTNAICMFKDCSNLVSVDLKNFDTSQIIHMANMFDGCSSLEKLDVSKFDTKNVTLMVGMFNGCAKLKTLDVSSFNTENVTMMASMFAGCSSLESLDLSKFNTGKVDNFKEMFKDCSSLTSLNVGSFDTKAATNMSFMFAGCSSLTSLNVSSFDTKAVIHMNRMFDSCSSLKSLDLKNFDTSNVTDMNRMFLDCSSLESLDLSSFNTGNAEFLQHMFNGCSSLKSLTFGSMFNTGRVTDMLSMFRGCSSLTSLDVSGFNTENVTNMGHMFRECRSLTSLDVSGFKTGNATNMSSMFDDCIVLTSLDLSGFDAGKLEKEESGMFNGCNSLTSIRTPYNLKSHVSLTNTESTDVWVDASGNEYKELPMNKEYSIQLIKSNAPTQESIILTVAPESERQLTAGSEVTLICGTADAEIYYTISDNEKALTDPAKDGKDSIKYTAPIIINADVYKTDVYIRAVAIKDSNSSKFINLHYTVSADIAGKALKPYAVPGQGAVEQGTKVELKCDTPDAEIYYAVGGNADMLGDVTNKYTGPIEISKDMVVKAVAKKDGMKDSDFSIFVYRVNVALKAPTADPASVTVDQGSYISLKADNDANIYYTTDLTDPTTSGSAELYENRIRVAGEPGSVIVIKAAAERKGIYSEIVTFTYTISESTVKGLQVMLAGRDEFIYTGNAITPAVIVTNNGEELIEGEDYTVKYSNNVKAADKAAGKAPKITVTGKGNLTKSKSITFTIKPKDIGDEDEVVGGNIVAVSGKTATPILFYDGVKLTAKDFDNPNAKKRYDKDETITITGKGNFEGTRDINVKVVDTTAMKKFTVVINNKALKEEPLVYDGEEKTMDGYFEVYSTSDKSTPLEEYSDYAVIYPKNNINAGKVKFTVVGLGEYCGTVTKSYTIKPKVIKSDDGGMDVNVNDGDTYSYTGGSVIIPDLEVTCDGDVLSMGRDYKVTYSNNKKICTGNKAKCKITFVGNYKGSKALVRSFNITAAVMDDVDKINGSVSVAVADMVYTGKPGAYKSIPYVTVNGVLLKSSDYNVSYYKDVDREQVIDGKTAASSVDLTNSEKQTVYMKIEGKGNYQGVLTAEYDVYKLTEGAIDLSKAKVTIVGGNKAEYTGEGVEPDIEIKYKSGSGWTTVDANDIGTYITVTYINNVNKGKATVMVNGNGDRYAGSKTATFSIVSKNMN